MRVCSKIIADSSKYPVLFYSRFLIDLYICILSETDTDPFSKRISVTFHVNLSVIRKKSIPVPRPGMFVGYACDELNRAMSCVVDEMHRAASWIHRMVIKL